ncbi:MAG: hypothetical protein KKB31_07240 [Nanoarchaeota archaeon]|nr:hypothetical protein [Nanoarchaeota archaeon]
MADNTTWDKIQQRMSALSPLHTRMDETEKMLNMEDFELKSFDGKKKLDNVVNVTGNRAAAYGHRVIENLASYKWQTVVEGQVAKREARTVEEFLDANIAQTNICLNETFEDVPDLVTFWAKHICNRGRIGVQWTARVENGEYKIDCVPLDMRYVPYVKGRWAAPIYWRYKDEMEQELEEYERMAAQGMGEYFKVKLSGNELIEARDFWDLEKNEFWVNKQIAYRQKNPYGKLPQVIVVAPSGFMFRGRGYIEHEGEDIYFLIRKLNEELNRQLSIEQTIGMDILAPPYEQEREVFDGRPSEPVPKSGESKAVRKGERHIPVPRGDLNKASMTSRQDIMAQMDDGAPMSPRAYTSPPSAIEVATEVELLNQLFQSRVTALQMGLSQLKRLMVDMASLIGKEYKGEVEIGAYGSQKKFALGTIKDSKQYSISCRLMTKNSKLEIVNEARALALWGRAPLKYILEDVLMVEDPDGWMREMELEKAKRSIPALALAEMALRFAEEADETEDEVEAALKETQWKICCHAYVMAVRQMLQPVQMPGQEGQSGQPQVEEKGGNANALISLMGARGLPGGGGQGKVPAEVG